MRCKGDDIGGRDAHAPAVLPQPGLTLGFQRIDGRDHRVELVRREHVSKKHKAALVIFGNICRRQMSQLARAILSPDEIAVEGMQSGRVWMLYGCHGLS